MSSTVLFFLREINHFFKTLSSFCIFEKALFLDPRDSILEHFEHRGSRIESRVSSVNLLLSCTVLWLTFEKRAENKNKELVCKNQSESKKSNYFFPREEFYYGQREVKVPGENLDRIFEDLYRSLRTCQRSLKIRIFQGSFKDLQRSSKEIQRSLMERSFQDLS